jgi:hypothetical protein
MGIYDRFEYLNGEDKIALLKKALDTDLIGYAGEDGSAFYFEWDGDDLQVTKGEKDETFYLKKKGSEDWMFIGMVYEEDLRHIQIIHLNDEASATEDDEDYLDTKSNERKIEEAFRDNITNFIHSQLKNPTPARIQVVVEDIERNLDIEPSYITFDMIIGIIAQSINRYNF